MEANLIHNGYSIERRKMYPLNPRNNMVSTIDMTWNKSLLDQNKFSTAKLKNHVNQYRREIKEHYTDLIDKQIELEKSLDKSSFRVLPRQVPTNRYDEFKQSQTAGSNFLERRKSVHLGSNGFSTISHENQGNRGYFASKEILQPVTAKKDLKTSGNLSRTVFGYEINPQNFKRQSYLTKLLSSRLDPYIEQNTSGQSGQHRRHKSVMANQIIDLNY